MNIRTILSTVLAAQLLLAIGISWQQRSQNNENIQQSLLAFDTATIDRIEVDDNDNHAVLKKSGDKWTLPDVDGLAADQNKITSLLDKLGGLQTGWPVATTSGSIDRLKVAEDNYERHLQLYKGDELLGDYYLGTSPGFRQTHGRRADDDEVYALNLNTFDLPGDNNDWLDKTLLSISDVEKVQGPDFSLVKDGDNWTLDPLDSAGPMLDQDKAGNLISALNGLRVLRVAGSLPDSDPVTFTVGDMERSWTYRFYSDDDNNYYVHRDGIDTGFTISKSSYDRIAGITRDKLLMEPAEDSDVAKDEKTPA